MQHFEKCWVVEDGPEAFSHTISKLDQIHYVIHLPGRYLHETQEALEGSHGVRLKINGNFFYSGAVREGRHEVGEGFLAIDEFEVHILQ